MDSDAAYRLVLSLSGVGLFLLVLEVWMANYAMGTIGLMTILGAIGLAFVKCSIDFAALILLGAMTCISLGVLLMLVYLPQSPLARTMFRHYAERARREAEAAENAADDDLWTEEAVTQRELPKKEDFEHLPPEPLEEELEAQQQNSSEKRPG